MLKWLFAIVLFIVIIFPSSHSTNSTEATHKISEKEAKEIALRKTGKLPPKEKKEETSFKEKIKTGLIALKAMNSKKNYKDWDITSLEERIFLIESAASLIKKAKDKKLTKEEKKLLDKYKKLLIKVQLNQFPKIRDAVGPAMSRKLFRANIDVKTIGKRYTRIVFASGSFASNAEVEDSHKAILNTLKLFRFKRADYKWMKYAREWHYYTIDSPKDSVIDTL